MKGPFISIIADETTMKQNLSDDSNGYQRQELIDKKMEWSSLLENTWQDDHEIPHRINES